MRSLRIVHVTNEAYGFETANGVQQVVYCLARAQADLGQSVAVFSRDDHAVNVMGATATSTRTRTPSASRSPTSFFARLIATYFNEALAEQVVEWRPDIVHFHSVHIPRNIALAARLRRAGIPYCVTVHGALFPAALRRRQLTKAIFSLLFDRRYLNEARFVHALSPHEVDVIRRIGVIRPIVTVANGLPPDSNARALHPDALFVDRPWLRGRRVFMFIGRLDPWQKGLDLLVEAFAQAGLQDAGLVLVGPDWRESRQALAALADRLGILPQLVFIGPAFGEERANLLAAADVFVHPSRWEGLSLSVLMAAAAGKPCLITREADPLGELERAQAAFVVDASVSSVADGLRRAAAVGDHELQIMGRRARGVAAAHFTWQAIASKLVDAYRGAIEGAHDRAG